MPTIEPRLRSLRAMWIITVGLAAFIGVILTIVFRHSSGFADLEVYRAGGQAVVDGLSVYDAHPADTGLPFTYPPFAAIAMTMWAVLPWFAAVGLWTFASVMALAFVIHMYLVEIFGKTARYVYLVPAITVVALLSEPVRSNIGYAQVNLFLVAAISFDLLRSGGRRYAGVLIGIAAGLKLTPLIFVVFLVLIGRRRPAITAAVTFGATVALGAVLPRSDAFRYWTDLMWDPARVGGVAYAGNQSIMGLLTRLVGAKPPTILWVAIAGLVAAAILLLARSTWTSNRALSVVLVSGAMLLASPISWSHHWVWAVPATLVLASYAITSGRRWVVALTVGWVVVFLASPIWWPRHSRNIEFDWIFPQTLTGNAYIIASLTLVAIAGVAHLRTGRQAVEPAPSPVAVPSLDPTP